MNFTDLNLIKKKKQLARNGVIYARLHDTKLRHNYSLSSPKAESQTSPSETTSSALLR